MEDSMRPPGMRDMLPDDVERFRIIESAFRTACLGWGYREVRTPTLERLHLFTAAGTLSPQMLDRVYSFLDWDGWSGERVVLRPDSTIPVVRLYVEKLKDAPSAKLFYVQNVLRFAQGDESREDWQCGAELIGDTYPLGDLELILIAYEVFERLGFTPEIKLSDPGILRGVLSKAGYAQAERLSVYDRLLDGDSNALSGVQERLPTGTGAALQMISMEGDGSAFLSNLRSVLASGMPEVASVIDELATIAGVLTDIGKPPKIAPALVRNFEYYTGPVFHLFIGDIKVAGGGRYDALISEVGGSPVPASGFALEMEPLASLLVPTGSTARPAIRIASAGNNGTDIGAVFALARALRTAGVNVVVGESGISARWIMASSEGFSLTEENGKALRLTSVEEVVQAVADAGHD
ncbi:MAG: histidine--tRNA ligase family protein [Chloroflexi bacterium]|nr:MAG: histidine--tRNA ligase family protein [Chloroflexota bacterium]